MTKRKIELCMTLVLLICMIVISRKLGKMMSVNEKTVQEETAPKETIVVVDAGHGGKDPGKIGVNDVLEKDLNLAIAKRVQVGLEKEGIQVVMTRKEDVSEESKLGDMKKRVELINEIHPAITVSIHQNSYSDPSVRGAQVFYFTHSKASEEAASVMHEMLRTYDRENTWQIKANAIFYMLKKTEVPTIIVECGFLSNPTEAEKLTSEEYQQQMADAICKGIIKWLDK